MSELKGNVILNQQGTVKPSMGLGVEFTKTYTKDQTDIALTTTPDSSILNVQVKQNSTDRVGIYAKPGVSFPAGRNGNVKLAALGGVAFAKKFEVSTSNKTTENGVQSVVQVKMPRNAQAFAGASAEYSHKINDSGNEIYVTGRAMSDGYGEAGVGFRF